MSIFVAITEYNYPAIDKQNGHLTIKHKYNVYATISLNTGVFE